MAVSLLSPGFKDCSLLSRCYFHGRQSLIFYKGFANNHLASDLQCAYHLCLIQSCVTKWCLNTSLEHCGYCNHRACLLASHGYLKLTRIRAMKQSEVTHIVMQWPGFLSFTFISLSLSYFPSFSFFSFYFHYHLPSPSLSLCTAGEDVCRHPGGVGEKSIVRVFEVFWKTSQGRRSCQGDR